MNLFRRFSYFAVLGLACIGIGLAQQNTLTSTTLSVAIADGSSSSISVTSATNIAAGKIVYVDREAMQVLSVSGTMVSVLRGTNSTRAVGHVSGAAVWAGNPDWFGTSDPAGACTLSQVYASPHINLLTGSISTCQNGQWSPYTDSYVFLPASACYSSVSGNSTGTNGYTTAGASVLPVVQAQTSSTGTNTHTFTCNLSVASRLLGVRGAQVLDVTFFYGVQTTALGTQVATLASGTINSQVVFSKITFPAAGASETASTVTPVRADTGTLLITPVVASANTATTTAGAFYSMKFTPSVPVIMNTDLQELIFSVALLNTATSATVTNSPGILVHYVKSID